METYRVDFTTENLRRDKNARTRLMRDVRRVAKSLKSDEKPRYLWKRRTDRSLGYWFQLPAGLQKDAKAKKLLEPYKIQASAPPALPQSEWKSL
ncbi:MAG TPA: hypothetical protein VEC19_11695 [Usitatibacter sp.]|nr:hypothetical protein [Usitatibacter sp.]